MFVAEMQFIGVPEALFAAFLLILYIIGDKDA